MELESQDIQETEEESQGRKILQYHFQSLRFLFRNVKYLAIASFLRNLFSFTGWLLRYIYEPVNNPQYTPTPYENQYIFLLLYWIFIGGCCFRAGLLSPNNNGDRNLARLAVVGEIMTFGCVLIGFFVCLSFITVGVDMCKECELQFQNSTRCYISQKHCYPSCSAQTKSHRTGRKVVHLEFCMAPWNHFYIWWAIAEFIMSLFLGIVAIWNAYFLEKHLNKLDGIAAVAQNARRFETALSMQRIGSTVGISRPSSGSTRIIPRPRVLQSPTMVTPLPFGARRFQQQQRCLPEAQGVLVA